MEEILPPITQEGAGFEVARVRQYTVFLENRVGRLQTLVWELEEAAGPIRALSITDTADAALVRLICADAEQARECLTAAGFSFSESDMIAVHLHRTNHAISAVCSALLMAEINIHYAYSFLSAPHGPALALYVDDPTLSAEILIKKGFRLLGQSDLAAENNG
jgi:hypothetical protein